MTVVAQAAPVQVDATVADWIIIGCYFVFIIGVGLALRHRVRSSEDFFLSGRALPSWVTGLAFMAANLGALEIMGFGASAAQYGLMMAHFYWLGAVPAMLFVGLVMMRFYYGSRVASVPDFLGRRFNRATRGYNAVLFLVMTLLMSGINMYAMAIVLQLLLGLTFDVSLWVAAAIVMVYIFMGGLSSAIYNEVLQLFLIFLGLLPLLVIGLVQVGGWGGLQEATGRPEGFFHLWEQTGTADNPLGATWYVLVLGLGWALSFGYWGTDFLVVQRGLAAENQEASRRTPVIASFPKMVVPFLAIFPGMLALTFVPELGQREGIEWSYNMALPYAIAHYLPAGMFGLGITALLASFMSGKAGNVSAFNTVWTYDLYRNYIRPDAPDTHYRQMGQWMTVIGTLISVGTAYLVRSFSNLMDYVQLIFSIVNVPTFGVILLGMFWRRATPLGGLVGLVVGTVGALVLFLLELAGVLTFATPMEANMWRGWWAWVLTVAITVAVSLFTRPKPAGELEGLVWSEATRRPELAASWYRRPEVLAGISLAAVVVLNWIFF